MRVEFKAAIVVDAFTGTSKKGYEYGRLKFLSGDASLYDVFVSADNIGKLANLNRKQTYDLSFELKPGYRGGVELVPAW